MKINVPEGTEAIIVRTRNERPIGFRIRPLDNYNNLKTEYYMAGYNKLYS